MRMISPDGPVYQAGTLSGNPLAMAAGLAQLKILERSEEFIKKIGISWEELLEDWHKRAI